MKHNLITLFPTAISVYENIDPSFTEEDKRFINQCLNDVYENVGNSTSGNTYVLEQLPKLKTLFTEKLKHHFYNVLEYVDETEIYITQSWMNLAVKDEYHHAHRHPNSVLSGVFYLKTVDEDCISFDNSYRADQVRPGIKNFNDYNSTLYNLNISDNMLVIFPSSLTHAVPPIKNKQTRISLAFNSFVKGKVGRDDTLSSITI